jgi:hypothetical protein
MRFRETITKKEKAVCIVCSLLIPAGANFMYLFLSLLHLVFRGDFQNAFIFFEILNLLITPFIFIIINASQKAFATSNRRLDITLNILAYLPFSILCLLFFITPILDFIVNLLF